jgi:hypothetical protein
LEFSDRLDDDQRPVDIDQAKLKVNLSQPGKIFPATISEVSTGSYAGMGLFVTLFFLFFFFSPR